MRSFAYTLRVPGIGVKAENECNYMDSKVMYHFARVKIKGGLCKMGRLT
jgi:hypothetical protein